MEGMGEDLREDYLHRNGLLRVFGKRTHSPCISPCLQLAAWVNLQAWGQFKSFWKMYMAMQRKESVTNIFFHKSTDLLPRPVSLLT